MEKEIPDPTEWIEREDTEYREGRIERLKLITELYPDVEWMIFGSGKISKYLFEEARYCFVYGQYLASIVLSLSFLDVSLGGAFYGMGRDDLERAGIRKLAEQAHSIGWLNRDDFDLIEEIRKYRNPITHFRTPGHEDRIETRGFRENLEDYSIIERDARKTMEALFRLMLKVTPWAENQTPKGYEP